jgi:hypothetical protein
MRYRSCTAPAAPTLCPDRNIHRADPRSPRACNVCYAIRCYLGSLLVRGAALVMLGRLLSICFAAVSFFGVAAQARAAELRLTFDELTRIVESIAAETQIYLNSVPGGLFTTYSNVKIGTQTYSLPTLEKKFSKGGSTYAYYVRSMTSSSVTVAPANRALRLTVTFKTDGPVAVAACVSGECSLLDFMPDIYWAAPKVTMDVVPVRFGGGISLKVDKVTIGGALRTACRSSSGLLSCNIGLVFAQQSIASLKTELPAALKSALNEEGLQTQLAEGLKGYLTVGTTGAVAINAVTIAPSSMTVNFRFNAASAK